MVEPGRAKPRLWQRLDFAGHGNQTELWARQQRPTFPRRAELPSTAFNAFARDFGTEPRQLATLVGSPDSQSVRRFVASLPKNPHWGRQA